MNQATSKTKKPILKKYLTHAEKMNARFRLDKSDFKTAAQRIEDYCNQVPGARTELNNAIKDFKRKNPTLAWKKVNLVRAAAAKISEIRIDDSMNRPLNWQHVLDIIRGFRASQVLAVNVYEDPEAPSCYVAWDGQHTTIVLFIISTMIYDCDPEDVIIPIAISATSNKAEIRENFIAINSDAQLGLDVYDLFKQMCNGVLVDGATNPKWVTATDKFLALEAAGIFMTKAAYQDTTEDGALTHIELIGKESLAQVERFAQYWQFRKNYESKHVDTKEAIMLFSLFSAAEKEGIEYTPQEISQIVDIFWKAFSCEFTGEKYLNVFWQKLDRAYNAWYDRVYKVPEAGEEDYRPKREDMTSNKADSKRVPYALVFLIYQLTKGGFKGQLPAPDKIIAFHPARKDLF